MDLTEYLSWYVARHQRRHGMPPAASTLKTKRCYLSSVAATLGATDEVSLATTLSSRERVEYSLDVLSARLAPQALKAAYFCLKSFGDYALAKGLVTHIEIRPGDCPGAGPAKAIVVYTPDEMAEFVTAAKYHSLRWWAFLAFLSTTGRRAGETLSLRWDWYHADRDPAYFELPLNKTHEPQYVPLTRWLSGTVFAPENVSVLQLEVRNGHRQWTRPQAEHPFPWSYTTVHLIFKRFCEKHGLPNRGFHNFRHTVITNRIADGMPIQAVAALAGHRTAAVTLQRYNHANALDYARYLE